LGGSDINIKYATLIIYFDEREKYIWKILFEFNITDPHKYNIDLEKANFHESRKYIVYYKIDKFQRTKKKFHRKFRKREYDNLRYFRKIKIV
jgi:hypothetical protein